MEKLEEQISTISTSLATNLVLIASLRFFAQDHVPNLKLETCCNAQQILFQMCQYNISSLKETCEYIICVLSSIQDTLQIPELKHVVENIYMIIKPKMKKSLAQLAIEMDKKMKKSKYHFEAFVFITQGMTRQRSFKTVNELFNKLKDKKIITERNVDVILQVLTELASYDSDFTQYLNIVNEAYVSEANT